MDMDLAELIVEIVAEHDILLDQYPRFLDVHRKIISFSKRMREELIKQGINRFLGESSADEEPSPNEELSKDEELREDEATSKVFKSRNCAVCHANRSDTLLSP